MTTICPVCGEPATRTTRTERLRHGRLEIKITYCHDISGCGFLTLDSKWLWHKDAQDEVTA